MSREIVEQGGSRAKEQLHTFSWREQLQAIRAWLPEREATVAEEEELLQEAGVRDRAVADHAEDVPALLRAYGIDPDKLGMKQLENKLWEAPRQGAHFMDERLPAGYGYKGGAARALLLRTLGLDAEYVPRDIDVVRLFPDVPDAARLDGELADRFMPDDARYGYGVEELRDNYFETRDLTINELYATDDTIFCSTACLLDTVRRIIRPTAFKRDTFEERLGPKMMAKLLRLWAEQLYRYGAGELRGVAREDFEYERGFISPFYLALQLDKAFEVDYNVARSYVGKLQEFGQVPSGIRTPEDAAAYLTDLMGGERFIFRHAPSPQFAMEDKWAERFADLGDLPARESSRKRKR